MSLTDKFKKLTHPIFWLQCLYYTLKFNGIVNFNLSMRPPYATPSRLWNVYSFIFTVYMSLDFYIGIIFYLDIFIPKDIIPLDSKQILFTISAILIVLSAESSIFLYFLQYWKRHKLLRLINDGFELHNHILYQCMDDAVRLSAKSKAILIWKLLATFSQFVFIEAIVFSLKTFSYNLWIIAYSYYVGLMMSSTFFCASFVVWQFFLMLNQKLKRCMAEVKIVTSSKTCQMRMQRFCVLSDQIDRLACLYARCLEFTEQMNKYFSATLLVIIAYAFAVILSQLFFIYGMIARLVMGTSTDSSAIFTCGAVVLFYTVDIYFVVSISNEVINAGRQPGTMLYSLGNDIDDRLNRSVS